MTARRRWYVEANAANKRGEQMDKLTGKQLHAEAVAAYKAGDVTKALAAHVERIVRVKAASVAILTAERAS